MSKTSRICGMLHIASPVTILADQAMLHISSAMRVERDTTVLGHTLSAFGPFALGPTLDLEGGAFRANVLDVSNTRDAVFDHGAFVTFVNRLNEVCSGIAVGSNRDRAVVGRRVDEFSTREGRDPSKIREAAEAMLCRNSFNVIVGDGTEIALGCPKALAPPREDSIDVDVAEVRHLSRVNTPNRSFVIDTFLAADLKVGDPIHIIDAMPLDEIKCMKAESATPLPNQIELGLADA